jgi:muramoyltetrapeptide carboxypeptidase LdcA involved in peptidoglycan recycling
MNVQEAKEVLKANGYFVDNLWCVDDVKAKFKCTDEQAQDVLLMSMINEATMEQIWFSIGEFGRIEKLEEIENN